MTFLKYCASFVFIILGYVSLQGQGIETYYLAIFSFICIPVLELIVPESKLANHIQKPFLFDLILYTLVPLYVGLFVFFLVNIGAEHNVINLVGKLSCMGILCGIFGINMAHELGHRKSKVDQFAAQFLLLTTQYTHFFIEHNRGHHKRVGTPQDPATAKKGESIYRFWSRVIPQSYNSAWSLEKERLKRMGKTHWRWENDMVKYAILQISLAAMILLLFGVKVMLLYLVVSVMGILLLEAINYIEHYGLTRAKIGDKVYEKVQDRHSWNSDHILGRALLFELTRHSHHHANSLIKYPGLESRKEASQLPTGYPGMILLSLIPILWFRAMDKRL